MKDLTMSMFANRQDYEAAVAQQKAMTPHDELMALAGKWEADALAGRASVRSPALRSKSATLSACAADLRALLDSDAFRAMVRNDARYRRLRENCRPWGVCSDEPHALIRICRGEFQGGIGWFNSIGPASRVGIIDLDTAVDAAFGEAIDAAASGAGEG